MLIEWQDLEIAGRVIRERDAPDRQRGPADGAGVECHHRLTSGKGTRSDLHRIRLRGRTETDNAQCKPCNTILSAMTHVTTPSAPVRLGTIRMEIASPPIQDRIVR